jgi:hypothetical protein
MSKQTINIGTAANDGSGDPLRTAFDKANDNFDELYTSVAALTPLTAADLFRSKLSQAVTAGVGQVITFSSQFVTTYAIQLIDYDELGIEVTAQDEDGFTVTALTSGNFGYIALIEV